MTNDDELIQIFIEEARDILENINRLLEEEAPSEAWAPMLRELHTLKGSARMVGLLGLNEYTHTLEQFVQKIQNSSSPPSDNSLEKALQRALDYIHSYIDEFSRLKIQPDIHLAQSELKKLLDESPNAQTITELGSEEPKQMATSIVASRQQTSADIIRIRTDLLEKFGSMAGQINIARAQVEQQLKGAFDTLAEIVKQVKFMQDQMRQLQVKTDANLRLYQATLSDKSYDEFDVLEMDRYSSLQQSTRVMSDKLNQIEDLNSLVVNCVRNAEGLLSEQKRSARNLEEGITHTRLISIDYLVPRLKRVVRQVSHELGKEVHLESIRVEGEIDRKILERLVSPLEHMVRNAIDHGIELPDVRRKEGKPEYGIITLSLFRQGNEIVIQLGDDGQGIDIEKVRLKALEKKMWSESRSMSQMDAFQMIFLPGFSTKDQVTHISGQGVGLDVVNAEVNKLGGLLRIDSQPQKGTQFTIRLPFAQSLNQALVFHIDNQAYALPLSHLAGVTRISFKQLMEIMHHQGKMDYAQASYDVFYLSALLGDTIEEDKFSRMIAIPVLFLLSQNHYIALIVDKLAGSSEIVIKSPGAQLQFVREISGVSILGDGQVVLILDTPSLITRALKMKESKSATDIKSSTVSAKPKQEKTKVLIVDDSITVRQVTSRLLKRHDFEPLTANYGIQALSMMATHLPNIVLLDIEMPRMDGFKLLEQMRSTARYKNIPVIMITSRSGEKHRIRALSLGANAYLTKPFIEEDLLFLLRKYQNGLTQ